MHILSDLMKFTLNDFQLISVSIDRALSLEFNLDIDNVAYIS